jgi:signal transduction histidine kinase
MTLTIFHKGLILVAIPLVSQLAILGLVARLHAENVRDQEESGHTKEVIAEARAVLAVMLDAETGIRGYALTFQRSFMAPYDRSRGLIPERLNRLRHLVADDPDQAAQVERMAARVADVKGWLENAERLVVSRASRATALKQALLGKDLMDGLRREVATFLSAQELLEASRRETAAQSRQALTGLIVIGMATALVSTGLLALVFWRGISGRLAVLAANARRLARGKELAPPLKGGDEIARLDGVFHEMATELRDAAGREREYTSRLEARVAERTAELTATNRELAEKNRENELFVYSVSHDLRSPLVNLQGFSKELGLVCDDLRPLVTNPEPTPAARQKALALLDGSMAESIHFIQNGVLRLSGIIDALLRLSRVGRLDYRWQAVDVAAVVRRVVESLRGTIAGRGATVTVGDLPPAWGDPIALEQVFANLIGNALTYLDPSRPGRIEVGGDGRPRPGAERLRTYVVRDNGLGIPDAYRQKIFQAFQRVHPDVAGGEGMGLAIVRRVLDRHGGEVWVESRVGEGSAFFVALPVPPPDRTPVEDTPAQSRRPTE